ncbi:uncharacterized protein LOC143224265 [Tachypleus tridentatus]|uniref:uncharacterized protein LOC143224265 n=1 Tax=Tachypleus tridentatus TaxID=6853 RepID=UPI003FD4009B
MIIYYKWELNGKQINSKRCHVNKDGMLSINPVIGRDAGVWRCKVLFREPNDVRVFNHSIRVKQILNDKYDVYIHYNTTSCVVDDMVSFSKRILHLLKEDTALKTVSINKAQVRCRVTNEGAYFYKVIVSVIVGGLPTDKCGTVCTRKRMNNKRKPILKRIRNTLERNGGISVFGRDNVHLPIRNTFCSVHTVTCDSGFVMDEKYPNVCRPCSPGSFEKEHDCEKCPINEYSEFYASTLCFKCPEGTIIDFVGASSILQCKSDILITIEQLAEYLIPSLIGFFLLGYFGFKCRKKLLTVTNIP